METEMKIIHMDPEGHFEKTWIEVLRKVPSKSSTYKEFESAVDLYHKKYNESQKFGVCQRLTPLHLAAITGHSSLYENLVDIVTDKNPLDTQGMKPLHYAAKHGHEKIALKIIEKVGAN